MEQVAFELLKTYGLQGAVLIGLVLWLYKRLSSGRIVVSSQSGADLEARAAAAEAEAKRLGACRDHLQTQLDKTREDLIAHLQSDSQRLRLTEVEACVAKGDKV